MYIYSSQLEVSRGLLRCVIEEHVLMLQLDYRWNSRASVLENFQAGVGGSKETDSRGRTIAEG